MSRDAKVFIGNIPFDCRESDVVNFFKGLGDIKEIVLKNSYGFCEFYNYYDARDAVKETNGTRMHGIRVNVEMAKGEFFGQDDYGGLGSNNNNPNPEEGKTTVFLGHLPHNCRNLDIENFFNGYGRLSKIVNKGTYGFVVFEEQKDAEEAVKELTGRKIRGENVTLEFAKNERKPEVSGEMGTRDYEGRRRHGRHVDRYVPGQHRIRVENLASHTAWQDLKDYMKQAGDVVYCKAHHEQHGVGMVEFLRRADMAWALEKLDYTRLGGRTLRLSQKF